jgi:multiple sugar transport system substrate-binding protein
MKKSCILVLAVVCLAAALWAGGGKQDSAAGAGPAATGVIGNNLKYDLGAPVNGGRNINIEFWIASQFEPVYKALVDDYMKIHPNVKITMSPLDGNSTERLQKVSIALSSGDGPDLTYYHNEWDGVLLPFVKPYPEDILPLSVLRADFEMIDNHIQDDGKLYYFDMGVMTSGIFYNKKLWAEAGLTARDIPKTWDQLVQVAKKLTKYDAAGNITQEGLSLNGEPLAWLLTTLSYQDGNYLFNEKNMPVVNSPSWKNNLKFIQDLFTVHKVSSTRFPSNNYEAFANGQSGMLFQWGWIASFLKNYPDIDWGFFNLPTKTGGVPPAYERNNGEATMVVTAVDKNKAAVAFDILKFFLASDKYLLDMGLLDNIVPVKKGLDKDPAIQTDSVLAEQIKLIDRTIWPGPVPAPYFTNILTYAVQEVLMNGKSIDASLDNAQRVQERDFTESFKTFRSRERMYEFKSEMK